MESKPWYKDPVWLGTTIFSGVLLVPFVLFLTWKHALSPILNEVQHNTQLQGILFVIGGGLIAGVLAALAYLINKEMSRCRKCNALHAMEFSSNEITNQIVESRPVTRTLREKTTGTFGTSRSEYTYEELVNFKISNYNKLYRCNQCGFVQCRGSFVQETRIS